MRGVQLVLGAASAAVGGRMPYEIVNSGTSCVTIGAAYVLQQASDVTLYESAERLGGFVEKAPAEVVGAEREKLERLRAELEAL